MSDGWYCVLCRDVAKSIRFFQKMVNFSGFDMSHLGMDY